VKVEVLNARGEVVFTKDDMPYTAGKHAVDWDGSIAGRDPAALGGLYTLKVTAEDSSGKAVASKVTTEGLVTGVEQKADGVYVSVGRSSIPMSKITSVWLAVASQPQTPGDDTPGTGAETPEETAAG
jgi:flagellar basal-body rod modification protein FlgD